MLANFCLEICFGAAWCGVCKVLHDQTAEALPDWRITCFFVDKAARGRGVAEAALTGALALIGQAGGGVVDSMPEEACGRKVAGSFLWSAGIGMFDRAGFSRVRPLGKSAWLVRKQVAWG